MIIFSLKASLYSDEVAPPKMNILLLKETDLWLLTTVSFNYILKSRIKIIILNNITTH